MRTEYIEKIIAFLVKSTDTPEEFRAQLKVQDAFKQVVTDTLFSTDYLLYKVVNNFYRIKIALGYVGVGLKQDEVLRQMESEIKTLIFTSEFDLKRSIMEAELPLDPSNPNDMSEIINTFYMKFTDSIDNVFDKDIDAAQALMEVNALKSYMIDEMYRERLLVASKVYNESGVEKSLEAVSKMDAKIKQLQACNTTGELIAADRFQITNYEDYLRVKQMTKQQVKVLYKMGIPPFDEKFSICNNDIVVLVAEVNAGKTRFIEDQMYRAYTNGCNITAVMTETESSKLLSKMVLMHMFHLFKITRLPLSPKSFEGYSEEDQQKMFDDIMQKHEFAERDLWSNSKHGKFNFIDNIFYEDCMEEFYNARTLYDTDIFFVDHSRAMKSNGATVLGRKLRDQKEQLAHFAQAMREAKTSLGMGFFVTSHPNSENSKNMSASSTKITTNLTAGATELSEVATRMFYMTQTLEGETKDTVQIHESKTRDEGKDRRAIILKRWGACNAHTYEESYQQGDSNTDVIGELTDVED